MIEGQMIDQILAFEKQLKNMVEERRAASEDQLRSHEKAVSDKSNELLTMRAKQPQPTSLGQASAKPEFSQNRWFINQGKRASCYRVIENSSTRIPIIPLHPAPLPSAMTAESEGAVRPLDGGKNQSSIYQECRCGSLEESWHVPDHFYGEQDEKTADPEASGLGPCK
ncbi:hypothetical protein B0H10DRAFT_1954959 [Mycena sp. CBHHK59/15]|nr:hypothetical protein B0H10DRAFT_1954959 [Mycena sp. CBHHK59/15]